MEWPASPADDHNALTTNCQELTATPLSSLGICDEVIGNEGDVEGDDDEISSFPGFVGNENDHSTISAIDFHQTGALTGRKSRIPGLLEWIRGHREWVDLSYQHGLKYAVMDDILKSLGAPFKSWKTVVSNIRRVSGLDSALQTHLTCTGHMCFNSLVGKEEITHCAICGCLKPILREATEEKFTYIPLVPRIIEIVADADRCQELYEYRLNREMRPGIISDFFDGAAYRWLQNYYRGEEALLKDIFIGVSTDGFQAFKNNSVDVWPVLAVLLNLDPKNRYTPRNVLPPLFTAKMIRRKIFSTSLFLCLMNYCVSSIRMEYPCFSTTEFIAVFVSILCGYQQNCRLS